MKSRSNIYPGKRENKMTDERFDEFLQVIMGPEDKPISLSTITALILALKTIVQDTGIEGDKALEAYCRKDEIPF